MSDTTAINGLRGIALLGIFATCAMVSGCARGEAPTLDSLKQARALWAKAGVRNYDLEWTVSGAQTNHYYVTVRDGDVRKVESIRPDKKRLALKPADTRFYSVDGLFLTIADELAQLKSDHPFDQPKGTTVVMRFKPDEKLGYPHWYRRDVMGTALSISIDVVKLSPEAAAP